jgi:hypothetical protein
MHACSRSTFGYICTLLDVASSTVLHLLLLRKPRSRTIIISRVRPRDRKWLTNLIRLCPTVRLDICMHDCRPQSRVLALTEDHLGHGRPAVCPRQMIGARVEPTLLTMCFLVGARLLACFLSPCFGGTHMHVRQPTLWDIKIGIKL